MPRSYIWSVGTRLFHALLVFSFVAAYLSSEEGAWITYHTAFGLAVLLLLLFRIPWGFFGPLYSRFRDFDFHPLHLKTYVQTLFGKEKDRVPGHNVASSFGMVAILVFGILAGISGLLALGEDQGAGVFGFLYHGAGGYKQLHEIMVNLFVLSIGAHVSGVLFEHFYHKSGIAKSMLHGYKALDATDTVTLPYQRLYVLVWIGAAVSVFFYTVFDNGNAFVEDKRVNPLVSLETYPLFKEECGSCHTLYPPQMLNQNGWKEIMADLENHFGDDASLDEKERTKIADFLEAHSGTSPRLDGGIFITRSSFWKRAHRGLDESIFRNPHVKSKANCKACHLDIEEKGSVSLLKLNPKLSAIYPFSLQHRIQNFLP